MNKLKNKLLALWQRTYVRRIVIGVAILLSVFLLELLLSNARLIFIDKDEYLTDYEAIESPIELKKDRVITNNISFPSSGVYAIKISSEAGEYFNEPITVTIKGYDEKRSQSLETMATVHLAPGTDKLIFLDYNGPNENLIKIEFSDIEGSASVSSITVNPSKGLFRFSLLRAGIILFIAVAIWLCSIFRFNREYFDISKKSHRVSAIVTASLCFVLMLVFCCTFVGFGRGYDYPLEDGINTYDPYVQQFDAFLKGQLHIDYPVSDELLELENPYDHSQREGIYYLWDRAMYDGKYYSYFGIAPIINIYLPYYIMTGDIASGATVAIIYALVATLFVCAFMYAYVVIYKRRVPVSLLSLVTLATVVCSGIPLMARSTAHFYYIPVIAGMSYLAKFAFTVMLAMNSKHKVARPVLFALAGASYAMLLLSRMNMALLTAFIVLPILYFGVVKCKPNMDIDSDVPINRSVKGKIIDTCALGAPVIIAIVFIFIYNYARFDNPLEFGASYQLTVSDASKNRIDFSSFTEMLYHSFVQPFKMSGSFPFFSLQYQHLGNYEGYLYVDSGMGLFAIPLMLLLVFAVYVLTSKKKSTLAKSLCIALFVGIAVVSVMNFYIGGVIYRYTSDLTLMCAMAGVIFMLSFNEAIYETQGERAILIMEKLFLAVAIFVCMNVLTSLHGYLSDVNAGFFVAIEEMF